ncbi:CCA tRNA nucleotidyltransferase [Phenylobacterium deserti]|uniref:CCA tRNA nucleotidyltransferase n=1 Tax=Phenylobacterium deserti TaxID=1914756 RepID=A0A328ASC9_9CAUL|nr:CCA tRNA nucleotidyltransferase [Phenylobacterium deserti]RAK57972.1 CCA tRNA nucleotidyltransferase [Phenylobacterium deserti]
MTANLGPLDWITAAETSAVLDALEAAGGADCARFVGGCVRNALIGRPISDVDIATTLTPVEVTKAIEAAGLRAVPTGIEHGTVTAIANHQPFEITTLRRDVETDGRRAVVAFTADWMEDAQRRDFTLNALYARRDGSIFDPTGHGVADALAGRIVFVGDAETRLREDYLRSLRFFRFMAWYGREAPDAAAVAAITRLKDPVASLAAERISAELLKLLAADDPRGAVALMASTGVMAVVLPEVVSRTRFEALVEVERGPLPGAEPVLRLAALLPDEPALGRRCAERLRLSNAERDRIEAALDPSHPLSPAMTSHQVRQALYALGAQAFIDRAKLLWAQSGGEGWDRLIEQAAGWNPPALPVNGADAMAAGLPKGPLVGAALKQVETWWIAQDFPADRDETLSVLHEVARELTSR